jgi:hypothetical protein
MSSKMILSIPEGSKGIPSIEPSLMPFHIAYSGSAPISTYFLEKPYTPGDNRNKVIQKLAKEESSKNLDVANNSQAEIDEAVDKKDPESQEVTVERNNDMFSAAFRGRRVIGQFVRVPEGFTGVVLTGNGAPSTTNNTTKAIMPKPIADTSKATSRAKALKAKAAAKLKAKGKQLSWDGPADDGEPPEDEQEQQVLSEDKISVANDNASGQKLVDERKFEITAKFQKFKLWSPDVPVDEGSDEYIRSLHEWMILSSEVRVTYLT